MPTYKITDSSTGKVFRITGDSPPTEQELDGIFKQFTPAQQSQPEPSFLEKAKKTVSDIGRGMTSMAKSEGEAGRATAETMGTLATGATSWIPGGLSMLVPTSPEEAEAILSQGEVVKQAPPIDWQKRAKRATGIQQSLSYEPKSEQGKVLTETVMTPLTSVTNKFEEGAEYSRQRAKEAENAGDYELAKQWYKAEAAANFGKEAWMFALPAPIKAVSALSKGVKTASRLSGLKDILEPVKQDVVRPVATDIVSNARQVLSKDELLRGAQKDRYVSGEDLSQKIEESHLTGTKPKGPRYEPEGNVFMQKDLLGKIETGAEESAAQFRERMGEEAPLDINLADQIVTDLGPFKDKMSSIDRMRFEAIEKDNARNRFEPENIYSKEAGAFKEKDFSDTYPQTIYNANDLVFLDRLKRDISGEMPWEPVERETATGLVRPVEEYLGKRGDLNAVKEGEIKEGSIVQHQGTGEIRATTEAGRGNRIEEGKEITDDMRVLLERGADPEILKGLSSEAVSNMKWMSDQMEAKGIIKEIEAGREVTPEQRSMAASVIGEKALKQIEKPLKAKQEQQVAPKTAVETKPQEATTIPPEDIKSETLANQQAPAQKTGIPEGASDVVTTKSKKATKKQVVKVPSEAPVKQVETELKSQEATTIPPKGVKSVEQAVELTGEQKKGIPEKGSKDFGALLEDTPDSIRIEKPSKETVPEPVKETEPVKTTDFSQYDLTDKAVQNTVLNDILEKAKDIDTQKALVRDFMAEVKRQNNTELPAEKTVDKPVEQEVKASVPEPEVPKKRQVSKETATTIEDALTKKIDSINKKIDEIETLNRKAIKEGTDVPEERLNKLYKLKQDRDIAEKSLYNLEVKPEKVGKAGKTKEESRTIEATLEDKKAAAELGIPTEDYLAKKKDGGIKLYSNPVTEPFKYLANKFIEITDSLEFPRFAKTADESMAHFAKRILQDYRIRIKNWEAELKDRGINIPENLSVYLTFERMPSKVADTMLRFENDVKKPLVKSITKLWKDDKVSFDDLTEYMQALDAKPRYDVIQKRLKDMKEKATPEELAELEKRGSGMDLNEANTILEKYRKSGKDKKLDEVAKMIHNIADARLQLIEKYGLESPEIIKQMKEEFGPTWVPWRGKEGVRKYGRTGGSYTGGTIKQALGRKSKATENPIVHILNDYQNTVIKIFENEPKRAMLEIARQIKDPDITVNEITVKQRLNKEGQVETYQDAVWSPNDPLNTGLNNVIPVIENGKYYYIKIKGDPLLVRAFQKLPPGTLDSVTAGIGKWTRALAQLKTMYSPEFILTNPFRDMFDAVHGLVAEHKVKYVADAMTDYKQSMKDCYDYFVKGKAEDALTKEFFENVQTGFWSAKDIQLATKEIGKQLEREVASGIKGGTARTWKAVSDRVSDLSSVTENAMRLSVYKTLRKNGHSMESAASYAKNVTLNFNRRGEWKWISNLYMFANPGIQGIKRFKDLTTTKRGMKIAAGVTTAAVGLNIMNRLLGGEDEAGINNFTKMSAGERARNFIIMGPDGKPLVKIPLGFQQRLLFGLANSIADSIHGNINPSKAAMDFADVFFDSFNPISGASITKGTAASLMPSITKPYFEVESNLDTFGRPIYPIKMIGENKPDSQLFFSSVSPISKYIAQELNKIKGGDKFHSGFIDVSPESIDHVVKNYTGGIGEILYRTASIATKAVDDMTPINDIGRHEIPLVRRFTGANVEKFSQNKFREIVNEISADKDSVNDAKKSLNEGDIEGFEKAIDTLSKYDDKMELINSIDKRTRRVSDINKEIEKIKEQKELPAVFKRELIKTFEDEKLDIYNQTIWQYNNRNRFEPFEESSDII